MKEAPRLLAISQKRNFCQIARIASLGGCKSYAFGGFKVTSMFPHQSQGPQVEGASYSRFGSAYGDTLDALPVVILSPRVRQVEQGISAAGFDTQPSETFSLFVFSIVISVVD